MTPFTHRAMLSALIFVAAACAHAADPSAAPTAGAGVQPATSASPSQPSVKVAKKSRDEDVVCRTEQVTGSRLGGKTVCATRKEWADRSLRWQEQFENQNPVDITRH